MPPALSDYTPYSAALAAFLLLALLLTRSRKPWLAHVARKPLLTSNEAEFSDACEAHFLTSSCSRKCPSRPYSPT